MIVQCGCVNLKSCVSLSSALTNVRWFVSGQVLLLMCCGEAPRAHATPASSPRHVYAASSRRTMRLLHAWDDRWAPCGRHDL